MRNFIVLMVATLFMIAITSMSSLAGNSGFAMTDLSFTDNGLGLVNTNHASAFTDNTGAVQSLVNNNLESPLMNSDVITVSAGLNPKIVAETDAGAGGHTPLLCFVETFTGQTAYYTEMDHFVADAGTNTDVFTVAMDARGHHPLLNYSANNSPNLMLI